MNMALPNTAFAPEKLLRDAAAPAPVMEETVRLGMPQLALGGLSESWLLKDLGDRHWMLLARMAGRDVPDFRDADGAPVYAAFSALSIRDAEFGGLGENDRLTIRSSIARVSRTQCASHHALSLAGRPVGSVELVSAFVRRAPGGGNHTVARVALEGFPPPDAPAQDGLAGLAAALRAGRRTDHLGFDLRPGGSAGGPAAIEIDLCPVQDFNGAGFLYFASFVAFVDRAEWHFDGRRAARPATRRRDVFFSGNIDPGERLIVRWLAARREDGTLAHHCRLERAGDGARLAEAFTLRAV
ncbi:Pnap_2097 family protein [Ancylobacter sp. TS-1]|uniref:Pnap_2097 family protein n=1 Tax=Ancylobacter sp. TS-1 TaxID=1850374 RepID=UPI001FEF1040|nr:Pnap_2097 family protein [Ancylobacter sp. TS-1]